MVSQKIYLALERARQQQLQQHIELYLAFSSRPCPGESVHWCLHHLRAARRILGRVIILSSVSISQVIWGSPGVILTDFLGGKSMGVGYWCTWFFYISSSSEKLQSLGTDLSVLTEHLNLLLLVDPFPIIKSCFKQMILTHIHTSCFMQMKTFFWWLFQCPAMQMIFLYFSIGCIFFHFPTTHQWCQKSPA